MRFTLPTHTHTKQQNKQNNANRTLYKQLVNRGKVGQAGTIPKLSNWVTSTMYSPSRPLSRHLFLLGCAPHFISFVWFLLGWAPHFTSSVLFLLGCAPHFKSFVMLRTSFHIRVASLNRTPPTTYPLKNNNQPTNQPPSMRYSRLLSSIYMPAQWDTVALSENTHSPIPSWAQLSMVAAWMGDPWDTLRYSPASTRLPSETW